MSEQDEKFISDIKEKIQLNKSNNITPSSRSPDFKNADEVKEYLDNLYIEYSYQCLNEKLPEGCHRLANFLENIKGKYKEATDIYKKTCDDYKLGRSCLVYSKNKALGRGGKQDYLEACKYSFISCDYGVVEGCLNAGVCLSEGVGGLPIDVPESLNYLNKACDANNPIACIKLFNLYIKENKKFPNWKRDAEKAFHYTNKACELNDFIGCMNASRMCLIGDGIPKDLELADTYRKKGEDLKKELDSYREQQKIVFGEQHK